MVAESTPLTLADRAVTRLRGLASGNGLEPASISLIEVQEDVFTLGGIMEVSPMSEAEPTAYAGDVKNKDRKMVGSFSALPNAVAAHRQKFSESPDWVGAVTQEIKDYQSQGWGLENAKVTLPEKSAIYAATEICPSCQGRQMLTCPQCQGHGSVTCTQCHGRGREQCYYCGGRGEDPQQPGQPCHTCHGTRLAPCRFCQSRGHLTCPTCQGTRGTQCTTCQGTGKLTQEISVTCGAETHFKFQGKDLPSGLRRGLDRIGIANLGKGHADVTAMPPPQDEDGPRDKPPFPILSYRVLLPYAELRMSFGAKKAIISAFGKKCALMGVPNFLDESLKIWRERLRQAALGKAGLEQAVEARALKEILALTVAGKGHMESVRKLYPFGLSNDAVKSILNDMGLALNKTTLKTRTIIAILCFVICSAVFYQLMETGFLALAIKNQTVLAGAGVYLAVLIAALGISWAMLNFSARIVLKRRFPQLKFALQQKIGKTGISMIIAIVVAFIALLILSPVRPLWLALLLH